VNVFFERDIELTIQLGAGTFGDQVGDTVTLSGLRIYADMSAPCGDSMGAIQLRVYGLTQSMMNQITTIGVFGQVAGASKISVSAGEKGKALTTIMTGSIWQAWADYNSAPEIAFNLIAYAGIDVALKPVDVNSYTGATDVSFIMASLSLDAGLAFVDNGVNVTLSSPYLPGTILDQIKECARAADIFYKIEYGTLTIWPKNGYVQSAEPIISADTGMISYPSLSSQGMTVKTLFNPGVTMGGIINVESSIPMATGKFQVLNLTHSISSNAPGGPWFTEILCFPLK
jgi:hypothetical protein